VFDKLATATEKVVQSKHIECSDRSTAKTTVIQAAMKMVHDEKHKYVKSWKYNTSKDIPGFEHIRPIIEEIFPKPEGLDTFNLAKDLLSAADITDVGDCSQCEKGANMLDSAILRYADNVPDMKNSIPSPGLGDEEIRKRMKDFAMKQDIITDTEKNVSPRLSIIGKLCKKEKISEAVLLVYARIKYTLLYDTTEVFFGLIPVHDDLCQTTGRHLKCKHKELYEPRHQHELCELKSLETRLAEQGYDLKPPVRIRKSVYKEEPELVPTPREDRTDSYTVKDKKYTFDGYKNRNAKYACTREGTKTKWYILVGDYGEANKGNFCLDSKRSKRYSFTLKRDAKKGNGVIEMTKKVKDPRTQQPSIVTTEHPITWAA